MHNNLILKKSNNGKGVFANRDFKSGEQVIEFHGRLFTYEQLKHFTSEFCDHSLQIRENLYIGPSEEIDDFINHSCNPNCGVKIISERAILIAIKNIKKSEEITFDYSTTMNEDDWEINCNCGSKNCRKKIRDFKYLPKKIQQKYIKLRIVPQYVKSNIKSNKKTL